MLLSGYKTYIAAGVAVITAIAGYLVGDVDLVHTIQAVATALSVAFLRHGIATSAA